MDFWFLPPTRVGDRGHLPSQRTDTHSPVNFRDSGQYSEGTRDQGLEQLRGTEYEPLPTRHKLHGVGVGHVYIRSSCPGTCSVLSCAAHSCPPLHHPTLSCSRRVQSLFWMMQRSLMPVQFNFTQIPLKSRPSTTQCFQWAKTVKMKKIYATLEWATDNRTSTGANKFQSLAGKAHGLSERSSNAPTYSK